MCGKALTAKNGNESYLAGNKHCPLMLGVKNYGSNCVAPNNSEMVGGKRESTLEAFKGNFPKPAAGDLVDARKTSPDPSHNTESQI